MFSELMCILLISAVQSTTKSGSIYFQISLRQRCEQGNCECGKGLSADFERVVCKKDEFCAQEGKKLLCLPGILEEGGLCNSDQGCPCHAYHDKFIGGFVFAAKCQKKEFCFITNKSYVCAATSIAQDTVCESGSTCLCQKYVIKDMLNYGVVCDNKKYCTGDEFKRTACADSLVPLWGQCKSGVCVCKFKDPKYGMANKFCREGEFCAFDDMATECYGAIIAFGQPCLVDNCACGRTGVGSEKLVRCPNKSMCVEDKTTTFPMCSVEYIKERDYCASPAGCFCHHDIPDKPRLEKYCLQTETCLLLKSGELGCVTHVIRKNDFCKSEKCICLPTLPGLRLDYEECPAKHYCLLAEGNKPQCFQGEEGRFFKCRDAKGCLCFWRAPIHDDPLNCKQGEYCSNSRDNRCGVKPTPQRSKCTDPSGCLCLLEPDFPEDANKKVAVAFIGKDYICSKTLEPEGAAPTPLVLVPKQVEHAILRWGFCAKNNCDCRRDEASADNVICTSDDFCVERGGAMVCMKAVVNTVAICENAQGCVCQEAGNADDKRRVMCEKGQQCAKVGGQMACLNLSVPSDEPCKLDAGCNCFVKSPYKEAGFDTVQAVNCKKGQYCVSLLSRPSCFTPAEGSPAPYTVTEDQGYYCGRVKDDGSGQLMGQLCYKTQVCDAAKAAVPVCEDNKVPLKVQDGMVCLNKNGGCQCMKKDGKKGSSCRAGELCSGGSCKDNFLYWMCEAGVECHCGPFAWRTTSNREYCDLTGIKNSWEKAPKDSSKLMHETVIANRYEEYTIAKKLALGDKRARRLADGRLTAAQVVI